MPKRLNPKRIHQACLLHFRGKTLTDIAIFLEINPATLSRWRKTQIWKDYYAELLEQYEQAHSEADAAHAPPGRCFDLYLPVYRQPLF